MIIKVNAHKCEIEKSPVNEKEINITKCEFIFAEEITDEYVKEAYFTLNGETYKQIIANGECDIPYEVLKEKGQVEIGVVAYLVENGEEAKRYNPSPAYFNTWVGSLKDNAENTQPITPSEMEQYQQALQDGLNEVNDKLTEVEEVVSGIDNIDVDIEKDGDVAYFTITKKDGTQETTELTAGLDGITPHIGDNGNWYLDDEDTGKPSRGEKGDKGDPGTSDYNVLNNQPQINGVTLTGNKSLSDLGIQPDKFYIHRQDVSSDMWVIEHNLNKRPSVTVVDSGESVVIGDVEYIDDNKIQITFTGAFAGKAYLN